MIMTRSIALVTAASVALATLTASQVTAQPAPAARLQVASATQGVCNEDLVRDLDVGGRVSVVLVKKFSKGDQVAVSSGWSPTTATTANDDLCVVKIIVGPGLEGPPNEWSTSKGMGVEIWLPSASRWQGRSYNVVPSGWNGSHPIASPALFFSESVEKANEGFVTAATDGGNPQPPDVSVKDPPWDTARVGRLMSMMLPDGSINKQGWRNFSTLSVHVMARSQKAIAKRYYGKSPDYNYLFGCSTGGRGVYASAQAYPGDFQGLLADCPSIAQSSLHPSILYPQLVMQRELGGKLLTKGQLRLVSRAAVHACDSTVTGQHDGYITDQKACTYDPTKDKAVLCRESGGTRPAEDCLTVAQATAINKMWYGPTRDGSVPDPKFDNGTNQFRGPNHMFWGIHRGSDLWEVAGSENGEPRPFTLPMDPMGVGSENPSLMPPYWRVGNLVGKNGWKNMSYADLADVMERGRMLQPWFDNVDADNPDLREFAKRGGKLLTIHGGNDQYSSQWNPTNYLLRVSGFVGGIAEAQKSHRLFVVAGMGHCGGYGTVGGAEAPLVPLDRALDALIAWVERGEAPSQLLAETVSGASTNPLEVRALKASLRRKRPVCMYPNRIRYNGGDVNSAESFSCVKE